jgi:hypothetical protein
MLRSLLLGLTLGTLPAQIRSVALPPPDERLQSDRAATVAWAAHELARVRATSETRALLASLQVWGSRNGETADVVRLHLLDALVQSDAKVPGECLLPHLRGITEVPAFVLLARDPLQNEPQLREFFFRDPAVRFHSVAWWAAGNLLRAQKTPGFAAWLLARAEFRLEIDVVPAGSAGWPRCGGGRFLETGDEKHQQLPGFPPTPVYAFAVAIPNPWHDESAPSSDVIAPGRHPVAFRRTPTERDYLAGASRHNFDDWLRAAWLTDLAPSRPVPEQRCEVLQAPDPLTFVDRVQDLRRDFLRQQLDLVEALVVGGAMTRAEAKAFVPSREFSIHAYDLPALPAVPQKLDTQSRAEPAPSGRRGRE